MKGIPIFIRFISRRQIERERERERETNGFIFFGEGGVNEIKDIYNFFYRGFNVERYMFN